MSDFVREMTFEEEAALYEKAARAEFAKESPGCDCSEVNGILRRGMRIIRKARELINAPTIQQPEWISCAERLPNEEDANRFGEVLAITKNTVTTYNYKWVRNDNENYFLWWMPLSALPQPPKGDK